MINILYDFIYWFTIKYGKEGSIMNRYTWPYFFKYDFEWFIVYKQIAHITYLKNKQVYILFISFNGFKVKYLNNWMYRDELEKIHSKEYEENLLK